ncbi:MAG: hypothetical protein AAFV29_21820, partial [Myxococcota bacterium]
MMFTEASAATVAEYRRRLADREERLAAANLSCDRLGNLRLLLAAFALALVIMPLFTRDGTPWWGLIGVAALFVFLGRAHDRAFHRRRRAAASCRYYREGLDRLEERWRTLTDDGADLKDEFRTAEDYADDLDLFGPASVFQLLNRTQTNGGRRVLAEWLMTPAGLEEATARQAAVQALAAEPDHREALVMAAAGDSAQVIRDEQLLSWAESAQPIPAEGALKALGIILPALLLTSIALYALFGFKLFLFIMIVGQGLVFTFTRGLIGPRADTLSGPERELARYAELIDTIERTPFAAPRLTEVQSRLRTEGRTAAAQIRGLERLVELLDARLNFFFAVSLSPMLLWELNLVLRTEQWRRSVGPHLRQWLRATGEVEALA